MTGSLVHLVVAVDAEAKPLISWFGLKRLQPDRGFPVFRHAHIALAISGPGKTNAAAATAHLHAACGYPRDALWINMGVAGHPDLPVNSCRVTHSVEDAGNGRSWFPPLSVTPPWPSAGLVTIDKPDSDYEHESLVDMEAAGFYATACRFSTSELVQVVKIVSDNRANPARAMKPQHLIKLVGQQLDALDLFLHRLGRLANEIAEGAEAADEDLAPYLQRWSFTASQRRQLAEQVRRLKVLEIQQRPPESLTAVKSASDLIRQLSRLADDQPFPLP